MSTMMGHYPVGMSECDRNGIFGGCGYECSIFLDGECDEQTSIQSDPDFLVYHIDEIYKLKEKLRASNTKIIALEKENKKLRNRFTRFDIMDLG